MSDLQNIMKLTAALSRAADIPNEEKEAMREKIRERNMVAESIEMLATAAEFLGLPDKDESAELYQFTLEVYNACAHYCRAFNAASERESEEK